jgi:outer membrane biosynthesis protein TonB
MALLAMLLQAGLLAQAGTPAGSPVVVSAPAPAIPIDAAAGGVVIAELSVTAGGRVERVDAIRTTPPYDTEVLRAVADWTFHPQKAADPEALSHVLVVAVIRPASFPSAPMAQPTDVAPATDDVPFPRSAPPPQYPADALGGDTVVLEAHVSADGQVVSTRVLSGSPPFTQVSEDAVGRWDFEPARLGDAPRASTAYVILGFREPLTGPAQAPGGPPASPVPGPKPGAATSTP